MSRKQIDGLTMATTLNASDVYPISQSGSNKKTTQDAIAQFIIQLSQYGFLITKSSASLSPAAIPAQQVAYKIDPTEGNLTLDLPSTGVKSGTYVLVMNVAANSKTVTVNYNSGSSLVIHAGKVRFFTFGDTSWVDETTQYLSVIAEAIAGQGIAINNNVTLNGVTINKVTITPPATGATLTIADGKTATVNASIILTGTDGKTLTVNQNLTLAGVSGKVLTINKNITLDGTDGMSLSVLQNLLLAGVSGKTLTINKSIALDGADGKTLTLNADTTLDGSGWQPAPAGETWTYLGVVALGGYFTVSGDVTGKYGIGDKIKLTQTTVKYFYVTAISYSSGSGLTTISVCGGTDYTLINASIASPCYSKIENPQGFPGKFNYTPFIGSSGGTITSYNSMGYFSIIGRIMHLRIYFYIGNNGTGSGSIEIVTPPIAETSINHPLFSHSLYGIDYSAQKSLIGFYIDNNLSIYKYDGSYPGVTGHEYNINGTIIF